MIKSLYFLTVCLFSFAAHAQVPYNAAAPNGYTRKASVAEQVGLTEISIRYHRPAVNGREGKIWGGVVHTGFVDQGFGSGNPAPWRAGANENTTIEFDKEVSIEGKPLQAGKYGFFVAYEPTESVIVFSKRTDGWGSFFYDEKDDVLRIQVKPRQIDKSVEHLKFEFTDQTPNSAIILLIWEKLAIPFKVEVDIKKQQFDAFVAESQNPRGFTSQGLTVAANWALQNDYELQKGLEWSSLASSSKFPGDPASFSALSTKALILDKLGKKQEAGDVAKTALPLGTVTQLQQFGKQLITQKNAKAALEVFRYNYNKNPEHFVALSGMARGLSATGDFQGALNYANKALLIAPNDAAKQAVQAMVDKLKANKDVN